MWKNIQLCLISVVVLFIKLHFYYKTGIIVDLKLYYHNPRE